MRYTSRAVTCISSHNCKSYAGKNIDFSILLGISRTAKTEQEFIITLWSVLRIMFWLMNGWLLLCFPMCHTESLGLLKSFSFVVLSIEDRRLVYYINDKRCMLLPRRLS